MSKLFRKVTLTVALLVVAGFSFTTISAQAHCQLPCGIFDDHARIQMMLEDAVTIERSMILIDKMSDKTDPRSQNQLVRWVMNKEYYSQNIITIISDYFLAQRVNSTQKDFKERLVKHHEVMIAAMRTKQNVDLKYVERLKQTINALSVYYPAY